MTMRNSKKTKNNVVKQRGWGGKNLINFLKSCYEVIAVKQFLEKLNKSRPLIPFVLEDWKNICQMLNNPIYCQRRRVALIFQYPSLRKIYFQFCHFLSCLQARYMGWSWLMMRNKQLQCASLIIMKGMKKQKGKLEEKEKKEEKEETNWQSIKKHGNGYLLVIEGKPNSKQSKITQINSEYIGVNIAAPPREGEANLELVDYISRVFGVKKTSVYVDKGSKARHKVLVLEQCKLNIEEAKQRLKSQI